MGIVKRKIELNVVKREKIIRYIFNLYVLPIIVFILLYYSPIKKEEYYYTYVDGDLSNMSHAYFYDVNSNREHITIRYNAFIAGNVLYTREIPNSTKDINLVIFFKNGNKAEGGWFMSGNKCLVKINDIYIRKIKDLN